MKMFSNAWKVCLLLLPMLGSAEEYVVATRLDESLVVPTATMLTSTWTGTTSWAVGNIVSNELVDFSPARTNMLLVDSPCLVFDVSGADYLQFDDIPAGAGIASHGGTASLTLDAGTDRITASAVEGTCWDLVITNASGVWANLPLQEGSGADGYDTSGNTNNALLVAGGSSIETMRSGTQSESHYFAESGGSRVLSFNGATSKGVASTAFVNNISKWAVELTSVNGFELNSTPIVGRNGGSRPTIWKGVSAQILWRTSTADYELIPTKLSGALMFYSDGTSIFLYQGGSLVDSVNTGGDTTATLDSLLSYNGAAIVSEANVSALSAWDLTAMGTITYANIKAQTPDHSYSAKSSTGTATFVDDVGSADITLTDVEDLYLPALADGSDDVAGLGITNPKGLTHNNGPQSIVIGATTNTYANLLTNSVNIVTNSAGLIKEIWE